MIADTTCCFPAPGIVYRFHKATTVSLNGEFLDSWEACKPGPDGWVLNAGVFRSGSVQVVSELATEMQTQFDGHETTIRFSKAILACGDRELFVQLSDLIQT